MPALALRRQARMVAFGGVSYLTIKEKRDASGFDSVDGDDMVRIPPRLPPLGTEPERSDEDAEARSKTAIPEGRMIKEGAERLHELAYGSSAAGSGPQAAGGDGECDDAA